MESINNKKVLLEHGNGSKLSAELVKLIAEILADRYLGEMEDSAIVKINSSKIAFTTDSFVVTPIFFENGNIGKIAVCGTVNDLAVSGAIPKYLTLSLVIEEGFSLKDLSEIIKEIKKAADEADVHIVAGDTKVVGKGEIDKIFINTAGIGEFIEEPLRVNNIKSGDKIILSGNIGEHSIHLLSMREGLGFEQRIKSDCAPLNKLINKLLTTLPKGAIKCMRDVTRGGLSAVLNEFSCSTDLDIEIIEKNIPITFEVDMAADMLGINPIHLANEGCLCIFVEEKYEEQVINLLHNNIYGKNAITIGKTCEKNNEKSQVIIKNENNEKKVLKQLEGVELPRLC